MIGHRAFRRQNSALRVGFGFLLILFPAPAFRRIAMQRVVGAGLVGDHIRRTPRFSSVISAALPHSAIDGRPSAVSSDARQGVSSEVATIHVAGTQTEIDGLLTSDVRSGAGQRRGQRLRAAHAAQTGGYTSGLSGCLRVLATGFDGFVGTCTMPWLPM